MLEGGGYDFLGKKEGRKKKDFGREQGERLKGRGRITTWE